MLKTILVVAANPSNETRLRLDVEVRDIDEGLRLAKHRDQFVLKQQWATRVRDLRRAMNENEPTIVHFCGHGSGEQGIVLEDNNGKTQLVSTEALANFFELFADTVECVVLNACFAEVQAREIVKHIPYVIGMAKGIDDKAAIEFAVAFYDSLAAGKDYERAYKFGRSAIEMAGISGHLIPKLFPEKMVVPSSDIIKMEEKNVLTVYNKEIVVPSSNIIQVERNIFTVPISQNPRFTGRQDLLTQLHITLATQRLVALCGLGGVGKTQVAVEYAYRHRQDYPAVLWLGLSSELEVHSRFAQLAEGLGIPLLQQEQEELVAQVKHWLTTRHDWLLLVDNADELENMQALVQTLLPTTLTGRVLFTTRQHRPPLPIQSLATETLTMEAGARFIVQQVYEVAIEEVIQHREYLDARKLSQHLGGLPLALIQAAAYMRAHSYCCAEYLELYQEYQADLLDQRGEVLIDDHPASVTTTVKMSLTQVRGRQPQAIELLQCCAVLHPDGIPEEVLVTVLAVNKLQLNDLLKPLLSYSLLTRHNELKEVSIHRLVQAVLRFELGSALPQWVERMVTAVEKLFPDTQKVEQWAKIEHWQQCERLLSSALACAEEIKQSHLETDSAARLLPRIADYLKQKADYEQSLQWYELALTVYEQVGGKAQSETVSIRLSMAEVYDSKGDYDKALSLCKGTLEISENTLGKEHPLTAKTMYTLALVYGSKGEYKEALPLYEQAQAIQERVLGEEHPDTATCLDNLAFLYDDKGEFEKALPLYERVRKIRERVLGEEHPDTAATLNNLAIVYRAMGQFEKALSLHQRDLKISERVLGKEHPDTATTLHNLAVTYRDQGDYDHALPLFERAQAIRTQRLPPDHPRVAQSYHDLGIFYQRQGQHDQALSFLERALTIRERKLGPDHPDTARTRGELALVYQAQGQAEKAKECYETALATLRTRLPHHPDTQRVAENYQTWQAGLKKKRRGKKG